MGSTVHSTGINKKYVTLRHATV